MTTIPHYRIAAIPADGIGPEVIASAIQVVQTLAQKLMTFTIEFTNIPWGTAYYKEHGRYVPEDALDTLRTFDASLFGAVGAPGMFMHLPYLQIRYQSFLLYRYSRPYLTLGASSRYSGAYAAICQCSSCSNLPGDDFTLDHSR
jgi:isocitrate/isopropylmalate dehydrogenase